MTYNYSRLAGRVVEKFETRKAFAKAMNLYENNISLKFNNKSSWKQDEIKRAASILEIDPSEIGDYFFTLKH